MEPDTSYKWSWARALPLLVICTLFSSSSCSIFGSKGRERAEGYRLSKPKTWKEFNKAEADLAYRTSTGNFVTVTSSCERYTKAPLTVLTKHLLFGAREINYKKQENLKIDGVPGLYSSVDAKLDGTPIWMELLVLAKRKCIFDFSLMGAKELSEQDRKDFKVFATSFKYN